jgi:hypothetical protein
MGTTKVDNKQEKCIIYFMNKLSPEDRSYLLVRVGVPLSVLLGTVLLVGPVTYFDNVEYKKDKPLAIEQIRKDGFDGVVDLYHDWNNGGLNHGFVAGLNLGSCALPDVQVSVDTNQDGRITNTRDYTFSGFSDSHTTREYNTTTHGYNEETMGTPFKIIFQNEADLASKLHGNPCSVIIAGAIAPDTNR